MLSKNSFFLRTDMADEAHNLWLGDASDKSEAEGVTAKKSILNGLELCEINILDENGEQAIGKARGKYFSLSLPKMFDRGSETFSAAAEAIAELIKRCCSDLNGPVLVAALGNPDITPDALGNLAASNLLVTAHLDRNEFPQFSDLSVCRPGVLGTSGIESAAQITAISSLIKPQLLIVIDALAGSDANRLCRCIQISDAGISPGSGVGNNRQEISSSILGIPVISIGMPTVIDAGLFGEESFSGMFVTPRSIDSLVRNGAKLIAYGINLAVHKGISLSDIDALIN